MNRQSLNDAAKHAATKWRWASRALRRAMFMAAIASVGMQFVSEKTFSADKATKPTATKTAYVTVAPGFSLTNEASVGDEPSKRQSVNINDSSPVTANVSSKLPQRMNVSDNRITVSNSAKSNSSDTNQPIAEPTQPESQPSSKASTHSRRSTNLSQMIRERFAPSGSAHSAYSHNTAWRHPAKQAATETIQQARLSDTPSLDELPGELSTQITQTRTAPPREKTPARTTTVEIPPSESSVRDVPARESEPREILSREIPAAKIPTATTGAKEPVRETQPREIQARETQQRETQSRETQSRETQPRATPVVSQPVVVAPVPTPKPQPKVTAQLQSPPKIPDERGDSGPETRATTQPNRTDSGRETRATTQTKPQAAAKPLRKPTPPSPPTAKQVLAEANVDVAQARSWKLDVDGSQRISPVQPISSVKVSDARICEVKQVGAREILVTGRSSGVATVRLAFDSGAPEQVHVFRVGGPAEETTHKQDTLARLQSALTRQFPGRNIELRRDRESLIVRGTASDRQEAIKIMAIVRENFLIPVVDQLEVSKRRPGGQR